MAIHTVSGTLGDRIVSRMKIQGILTRAQLAREVGRDRKAIHNWIEGTTRPRRNSMEALARILKVSPEWLEYGGTEATAKLVAENDALKNRIKILNQMIETFINSPIGENE